MSPCTCTSKQQYEYRGVRNHPVWLAMQVPLNSTMYMYCYTSTSICYSKLIAAERTWVRPSSPYNQFHCEYGKPFLFHSCGHSQWCIKAKGLGVWSSASLVARAWTMLVLLKYSVWSVPARMWGHAPRKIGSFLVQSWDERAKVQQVSAKPSQCASQGSVTQPWLHMATHYIGRCWGLKTN